MAIPNSTVKIDAQAVWRPTEDPHLSTRSLVLSVTTVQLQSFLFEESVPQ